MSRISCCSKRGPLQRESVIVNELIEEMMVLTEKRRENTSLFDYKSEPEMAEEFFPKVRHRPRQNPAGS